MFYHWEKNFIVVRNVPLDLLLWKSHLDESLDHDAGSKCPSPPPPHIELKCDHQKAKGPPSSPWGPGETGEAETLRFSLLSSARAEGLELCTHQTQGL
jgi:hypothetical protein